MRTRPVESRFVEPRPVHVGDGDGSLANVPLDDVPFDGRALDVNLPAPQPTHRSHRSPQAVITVDKVASSKLVDGVAQGRLAARTRSPDSALADLLEAIETARLTSEVENSDTHSERLRGFMLSLSSFPACDGFRAWRVLASTLREVSRDEILSAPVRAQAKKLEQRFRREKEMAMHLFSIPILFQRFVNRVIDRAAAKHLEALGYPLAPLEELLERGFFEAAAAIAKHWHLETLDQEAVKAGLSAIFTTIMDQEKCEVLAEIAARSGLAQHVVDAALKRNLGDAVAAVKIRCPEVVVERSWLEEKLADAMCEHHAPRTILLAEALGWPPEIVAELVARGTLNVVMAASKKRDLRFVGRELAEAGIRSAVGLRRREIEEVIADFTDAVGVPAQEAYDLVIEHGGALAARALRARHPDLYTKPELVRTGLEAAMIATSRGSERWREGYTESELAEFALNDPSEAVFRALVVSGRAASLLDFTTKPGLPPTPRLDRRIHAKGLSNALTHDARYSDQEILALASLPSELETQVAYDKMIAAGRFKVALELRRTSTLLLHTEPAFVFEGLGSALDRMGDSGVEQDVIEILEQVDPTQIHVDQAARFGCGRVVAWIVARSDGRLHPTAEAAALGTLRFMTRREPRCTEEDALAWSEWVGPTRQMQELARDAGFFGAAEAMRAKRPFPDVAELLSTVFKAKVEVLDPRDAGCLDAESSVVVDDALTGAVRSAALGKIRFLDVVLRSSIIAAGEELALSSCMFAGAHGTDRANPELWTMGKSGRIQVRKFLADGRIGSPAAAYRDIVRPSNREEGTSLYAFECAISNQVVLTKGMLNFLERVYGEKGGEAIFDALMTERRFPSMYKWDVKPDLLESVLVCEEGEGDLIPGSQYHYVNPDTKPPWGGENVIALGREPRTGEPLFFAHGMFSRVRSSGWAWKPQIAIVSESELLAKMGSLQAAFASRPPYRELYRNSIDVAKLMARAEPVAARLGIARRELTFTETLQPRDFSNDT